MWLQVAFNLGCKNSGKPLWWHFHRRGTKSCSLAGHLGFALGPLSIDVWRD